MRSNILSASLGILAALLGLLSLLSPLWAAEPTGAAAPLRPTFDTAWGINPQRYHLENPYTWVDTYSQFTTSSETDHIKVLQIACSLPTNILWPGEKAELTIQVQNKTDKTFKIDGKIDVINYRLISSPTDAFRLGIEKIADIAAVPISLDIAPHGYQDIVINPPIPETKGGYALIFDVPTEERLFVASMARTFRNPKLGKNYRFTMDIENTDTLQRLGTTCNRMNNAGVFQIAGTQWYDGEYNKQAAAIKKFADAGLPTTIEFGGAYAGLSPLSGKLRPHLHYDDKGKPIMTGEYPADGIWAPQYDKDFKAWVKRFAIEFGWPKGPIIAMKLYNEPWEGDSCAGWGADLPRYREIYTVLCEAVEEARKEAGVQVMVGGCDSSSNTYDKLFSEGDNRFLQRLDFMSIHYQGLNPNSTVKAFVDRKNDMFGRVQIWDTESWCANSDERVSATLPSLYAAGYDHVVGIRSGCIVAPEWNLPHMTPNGGTAYSNMVQGWSVAASVGALQHFVGNREFDKILYDGLPFVYLFKGMPNDDKTPNPEDGTAVVVGDIGRVFGEDCMLFRTVHCADDVKALQPLYEKLATLPVGSAERAAAERAWNQRAVFTHANLVIDNPRGLFSLYDYYGNRIPDDGKIMVPLNASGYFLRANGDKGSFDAMVAALRAARVKGMQPVEILAHDPTTPLGRRTAMTLTLHNVLPQPVQGTLHVQLGKLTVIAPAEVALAPNERKDITVQLTGGKPNALNAYPLNVTFDAGKDGIARHAETMHCNVIARRTIKIDGKLKDWKGVLPQMIMSDGVSGPTLTEAAWKPYAKFDSVNTKGLATAYMAYDKKNFYFAAKIADSTPDAGTIRMATRNDDEFYYPDKVYAENGQEYVWPAGVRHYSYAKNPILPAGNGSPNFDNIQLAFNVLSQDDKPWYAYPKGTLPHFVGDWCTDYEYALNKIAKQYGGGTEIWRLRYPGMPSKHFYPRQPKSPVDGPANGGKLVIHQDGNTRIVECALPWTEIPDVKKALDAGKTIKFSFRANDDKNDVCLELARYRSVSIVNQNAFKVDWTEHWGNEVEFGFAK